LGKDVDEARKACPNYNGGTITTPMADKCGEYIPMKEKRIFGFNYNWQYDTLDEAKARCGRMSECTGIYQSKPGGKFEARTGEKWGFGSKGSQSWACHGYKQSGEMVTTNGS
jgi:hypothetical protein